MNDSRRKRRTKADIEKDINDAAVKLIAGKGFANVQLTEITREAEIDPPVFYNRYKNLEEFYSEFVKKYDYWLSDKVMKQDAASAEPSADECAAIMDGLIQELINDPIMLEILRWEVGEGNEVTERTAIFREMLNMQLVFKYKKLFRDTHNPIDIAAFAALMIGGIYYLFLHRDRSSFCGLDLNSPRDIELLRTTVSQLIRLVFSMPPSSSGLT